MLCTEQEAKNKWCPMVRFVIPPPIYEYSMPTVQNNRFGDHNSQCIASECMWWRWEGDKGCCGGIENEHQSKIF